MLAVLQCKLAFFFKNLLKYSLEAKLARDLSGLTFVKFIFSSKDTLDKQ